jgi:MFS superfamily sulfate permease-like transporter
MIAATLLPILGSNGSPERAIFPPLTVPSPISDLPLLIAGALGIALVALTDTISTASSFAARTGQEIDGDGGAHGEALEEARRRRSRRRCRSSPLRRHR